ncbi:MAG TPA: tetratricopeptide repeat protein [Humisphaera sp.]|jgi:tetratricopeptide (TPR) repeat protein|nr:tetratricopeptide repeat protein [Humisphaera sp.]
MLPTPIDTCEFVATVQPMLERQDAPGLTHLLRSRYSRDQIVGILNGDDLDARKVAALSLALVGSKCCVKELAKQLTHPDPVVNQMAEHAMWSIWFRCGTSDANHELCRGTKALNRREFDCAIKHFTRAIELDPTFAEAYNQRAITKFLCERYTEAMQDCLEAVERMPCHFGAWAGMGHCYAHEGQLAEAISCYQRALEINPHLDGVRQAICELSPRVSES